MSPAHAYFVMADILGDGYFTRSPDESWPSIEARGRDGVTTAWKIPTSDASLIVGQARSAGLSVRAKF